MKAEAQGFAISKGRRDLQRLGRILASLFKVALLATALGCYWRWNHDDPGAGPLFLNERSWPPQMQHILCPPLDCWEALRSW
jgi:hypothetical protein